MSVSMMNTLASFVDIPGFKYEDVKEALNYFKKGCSMIKWDLKNGYHLVKIHKIGTLLVPHHNVDKINNIYIELQN